MDDHTALLEEYKLVQSKLDSIGGFKFHVRGWSVTIISALVLAALTQSSSSHYARMFLVGLAFTLVIFFHSLEEEQESVSRALRQRALRLDREIDRVRRASSNRGLVTAPWVVTPRMASQIRASAFHSSNRPRSSRTDQYPRVRRSLLQTFLNVPQRVLDNLGRPLTNPFFRYQLIVLFLTAIAILLGLPTISLGGQ